MDSKEWFKSKGKIGGLLSFLSGLVGGVIFYFSEGQFGLEYSEAIGLITLGIGIFGVRDAIKN